MKPSQYFFLLSQVVGSKPALDSMYGILERRTLLSGASRPSFWVGQIRRVGGGDEKLGLADSILLNH